MAPTAETWLAERSLRVPLPEKQRRTQCPGPTASAFTLLEVILALAILAAAVAMIGELIAFASQSASDSDAETRAQLLAVSLMDELVTGKTKLRQQSRESLDVDDVTPWVYSISLERTKIDQLTSVEIVVEQDLEKKFHPIKYRLVRWLPKSLTSSDSENEDEEQEADESDSTEKTSSNSEDENA